MRYFSKPKVSRVRRLILDVHGEPKTGKTHLALTAPGPIAYFDFDWGLEGVLPKLDRDDVFVIEMTPGGFLLTENAGNRAVFAREWEKFVQANEEALREAQTIVYDTFTEAWELARLAHFAKNEKIRDLTRVMPQYYPEVNAIFRSILRKAKLVDKHIIMVHKVREEWIDGNPTGRKVVACMKDVPYNAQMGVTTVYDPKGGFAATIDYSRHNPMLAGVKVKNPNFNTLLEMAYE